MKIYPLNNISFTAHKLSRYKNLTNKTDANLKAKYKQRLMINIEQIQNNLTTTEVNFLFNFDKRINIDKRGKAFYFCHCLHYQVKMLNLSLSYYIRK